MTTAMIVFWCFWTAILVWMLTAHFYQNKIHEMKRNADEAMHKETTQKYEKERLDHEDQQKQLLQDHKLETFQTKFDRDMAKWYADISRRLEKLEAATSRSDAA
jgi:hypothetical protein